jgi:fumarate hydratase class II
VVWQTGSGTQTNMNANEVIPNRAIEMLGGAIGSKRPVHRNDHVNRLRSPNDAFPIAMRVAAAVEIKALLLPAPADLAEAMESKAESFKDIIKIGVTHLRDATPLSRGQEFSGYAAQLRHSSRRLEAGLAECTPLVPRNVNPTQCEAMTMGCVRVLGNHASVTLAGGQGHLQLSVFKSVIADATLQSIRLLADATASFTEHSAVDLAADTARISDLVSRSLMLVTALAPIIGYDEAAHIAKAARRNGTTLLKEVMAGKIMDKRAFEDAISLARMIARDKE